jgi:predicted HAD superfamily Cof-like phosphohydrolase
MKIHFTVGVQPARPMTETEYQHAVVGVSLMLQQAAHANPHLAFEFTPGKAHVEFQDVNDFHNKFMVPMSPVPAFLDPQTHDFRTKFLDEELKEFKDAYEAGDLDLAFDSLLDLVYVAVGTALKMGLPWPAGWQRVQAANMTKRLAKPDGSDSKRGSPLDVIKPDDFIAPSHWRDLRLEPGQAAPVFNAIAAIAALVEARKAG